MVASGVLKECALSSAFCRICWETRRRSCTSLSKSRATLDSSGTTLRWLKALSPMRPWLISAATSRKRRRLRRMLTATSRAMTASTR